MSEDPLHRRPGQAHSWSAATPRACKAERDAKVQALLTAMLWHCEGQHGLDVQSDSGVPRQLQPKVCIDLGVLHCSKAKTWLHTLASSQLLHIPTDTLVSTAEKLENGKGRML